MTLNEYQEKAMATCMESCRNPLYMLGLIHEEAGELQGKLNKALRKKQIVFNENQMIWKGTTEDRENFDAECMKELGDLCWAVAGFAAIFGWDLVGVGQTNLDKLADRRIRGVIDGKGDNR